MPPFPIQGKTPTHWGKLPPLLKGGNSMPPFCKACLSVYLPIGMADREVRWVLNKCGLINE